MTAAPEHPPTVPCYAELADLLAKTREDTTYEEWRSAMQACQTVGWGWLRVYEHTALILREGGGPRDLLNAAGPLARTKDRT